MSEAVALAGASKRYGAKWAVRDLDLSVESGWIYGFLGPNGAGKSTTIRMLLGLVKPTGGEVRIWGEEVGPDGILEDGVVGALVEGPAFYEYFSGYRNLAMLAQLSGRVRPEELEWALRKVKLWGRHGDKVGAYSHGMRQRLAIAQALVPRPRLLVLDEPAQGLDPQGLAEVRDLLRELADEGMTVFLSSHLLHEVEQICSHVGVIVEGSLITSGRVCDLLASDGAYEACVSDVAGAEAALAEMELVRELRRTGEDTVAVWLHEDKPEALNRGLVQAGIGVKGLREKRTELEEVYLQVTGEGAEEGSQGGEGP